MSLLHALILGIVQGITEYIPVSSSAHLVLVPWLLGWPVPPFTFDVLVQWGTLVGVFVYFWRDLWDIVRAVLLGLAHRRPFETPAARMGWYIVLGTLPAVVFGFFLKDFFEGVFRRAGLRRGAAAGHGRHPGRRRALRPARADDRRLRLAGRADRRLLAGGGAAAGHQPQRGDHRRGHAARLRPALGGALQLPAVGAGACWGRASSPSWTC